MRLTAVVIVALIAFAVAGSSERILAAGGNGESFCSNAGQPTGDFPLGDPGNPGEAVSWIARNVGHSADLNPGNAKNEEPPILKVVCNPNISP